MVRSKMRMLASTAMPTESTKPAMPARVSVTGMSRKIGQDDERVVDQREVGHEPRQPVVDEHEREDEADPDGPGDQARLEELLAQRRADLGVLDRLDRERQRAVAEDRHELVHLRTASAPLPMVICPDPPVIGSLMLGAEITVPSRTIAKNSPTWSFV